MKKTFLPLLCCLAFFGRQANGQDNYVLQPPTFLPGQFYNTFDIHLPLYNGRIFTPYPVEIKGQALLPEDHWAPVTVLYDGVWYNATGRYDRYTDELIIRNQDSTCMFMPNRDLVGRFEMEGRRFVKLEKTDSSSLSGYYEMISDGAFAVLIKRSMVMDEDLSGLIVERGFVYQPFYYVRKMGQYHQVRNKSQLYKLISEKKNEIVKELKKEEIKYKKDPEAALKIAAGFYK